MSWNIGLSYLNYIKIYKFIVIVCISITDTCTWVSNYSVSNIFQFISIASSLVSSTHLLFVDLTMLKWNIWGKHYLFHFVWVKEKGPSLLKNLILYHTAVISVKVISIQILSKISIHTATHKHNEVLAYRSCTPFVLEGGPTNGNNIPDISLRERDGTAWYYNSKDRILVSYLLKLILVEYLGYNRNICKIYFMPTIFLL